MLSLLFLQGDSSFSEDPVHPGSGDWPRRKDRVPEFDRVIEARRSQRFPVRGKGHSLDLIGVPLENLLHLAGRGVPQADCLVGTTVKWTNGAGQSGKAVADKHGLVTLKAVQVSTGKNRVRLEAA